MLRSFYFILGALIDGQCCTEKTNISVPNISFNQQTTTTTSSPTPATTIIASSPAAIFIYLQMVDADGAPNQPVWVVFDATPHDHNICTASPDGQALAPDSATLQNPPYPSYLKFNSYGLSDCVYTGTSSTIGSLSCSGFNSPVSCTKATSNTPLITCTEISVTSSYAYLLQCSW
jgi:hypothetical protein